MKKSHTNSPFIVISVVLLLILLIRVTRGLDLTDEMQYYGQIRGLIETGKLFSNDLFIQQTVYILFYPALTIYNSVFGFEAVVFFCRLLMAVLSIAVFLYAYQKFLKFNFSFLVASLTALSLTFAIPYHGVFAPSYNTISQVLWIVFMIRFYEWKQCSSISWGVIPVITAFAHPVSAVIMSLLVILRFTFEQDFRQAAKVMLALLGGTLVILLIFFYFATPKEYLDSLTFSSGYGVGSVFFSSKSQSILLIVIYSMFGAALLFRGRFRKIKFALLTCIFMVIAVILFSTGLAGFGYSWRVVCVLSALSTVAYCWYIENTFKADKKLSLQINWLVVALLAYATTLGVTSGNGIGQSTGAFMVAVTLLLGFAVGSNGNKEVSPNPSLIIVCVILLPIIFLAHWSRYSYREVRWWQASQPIQTIPEFKFINTSIDRLVFIRSMQKELQPIVNGKRTLIISEYPGLYFVLGAHPETSMLYMHSLTSDKSEKVLLSYLSKKNPEIVIDVLANMDNGESRIKKVLHGWYSRRNYRWADSAIKFNGISNDNPEYLNYFVGIRKGSK
jgi:hypothetical protein